MKRFFAQNSCPFPSYPWRPWIPWRFIFCLSLVLCVCVSFVENPAKSSCLLSLAMDTVKIKDIGSKVDRGLGLGVGKLNFRLLCFQTPYKGDAKRHRLVIKHIISQRATVIFNAISCTIRTLCYNEESCWLGQKDFPKTLLSLHFLRI